MKILKHIQMIDTRLLFFCFNSKLAIKHYAKLISKSADGWLYVVLPLLYWLINPELGQAFLSIVVVCYVIERGLYYVLKNNLKRRRPPKAISDFNSLITASDEFSFPSGHTSAAFLFSTLCVLWFGTVALPLFLWAFLVGCSRIWLGVHFPTDTLAGAALGCGVGYFVGVVVMLFWI